MRPTRSSRPSTSPAQLRLPDGRPGVRQLRLLRRVLPLPAPDGAGVPLRRSTEVGLVSIARPLVFVARSPIAGYAGGPGRRADQRDCRRGVRARVSMVLFASLADRAVVAGARRDRPRAWPASGWGWRPVDVVDMANEVKPSEFGVMSAAQMLAIQVARWPGSRCCSPSRSRWPGTSAGSVHTSAALLASFHVRVLGRGGGRRRGRACAASSADRSPGGRAPRPVQPVAATR